MESENETKSRFNKLPAFATEYIKQVLKKMRYRRKVRQDVQAELAAHFEDGLKDCKSDEDKEQKAQQLITEFGDVKLLAVLLRRAKKRCRPFWRKVVARTFQTVGVLILCLILYAVWFSTGRPTISVDYLALINQMNQPQLRDEDNAWPHYEKAIELFAEPDQSILKLTSRSQLDFKTRLQFGDLSEINQNKILKWIEQNETHWDKFSIDQKQLLQNFFDEGIVPYRLKRPFYREYRSFDSIVEFIMWKIESQMGLRPSYDFDLQIIKFNPNDPRDTDIKKLFEQNITPDDLETSIEVGVLKHWIRNPQPAPKTLFDTLLHFEKRLITKWIEGNKHAWQEFVTASSKSYCYREYKYDPNSKGKLLWDIALPYMNTLKRLAKLGIWRSRIEVKEGQTRKGLEDCLAVARTGSHWQKKGTIIEQLVGLAISRIASEQILHITATRELSATDLKQVQQQLSQIYPEGHPLMDMEGERIAFLDIVQHVFTNGGLGGGHLIPHKFGALMDYINLGPRLEEFDLVVHTAAGMIHARRDETTAKFNHIFDKLTENAKMSPYKRHMRNIDESDILFVLPRYRYSLIHIFVPAVGRIFELTYQGKTLHEAMVMIMALKRWRLENNEYPESLNELIAFGFLKELPMDPYSDKSLVYKKTDDNFTLYSVGPNFTDEGGEPGTDKDARVAKWRDNGDTVLWPVPKPQVKK